VLMAAVQGSDYMPYTVRVTVRDGDVVDATCTCLYHYGGWCKHIVAALLAAGEHPERVEERPSLTARLSALSQDELLTLLQRLIEREPEFAAAIERSLPVVAIEAGNPDAVPAVDPAAIKARIGQSLHGLDRMRPSQAYWHVGGVVGDVRQELEPARALLDADQARAALDLLRAVTDAWSEQWTWLDDSDGEASGLFYEIEPLLIEALLAAGLSRSELNAWADRIEAWIAQNSDYGAEAFYEALAAARNGWDEPHLLAVLNGESDVLEGPDDPELEESDTMIAIRLRVLARHGQDDEALRLAAAAGHVAAYTLALIRRGQIDAAEKYALSRMTEPAEAREIAGAFQAAEVIDSALRVGERGLSLAGQPNWESRTLATR
ncbi:MAG: SWIM zinc finger family protein, partial [Vicinamibacterales bacterium]